MKNQRPMLSTDTGLLSQTWIHSLLWEITNIFTWVPYNLLPKCLFNGIRRHCKVFYFPFEKHPRKIPHCTKRQAKQEIKILGESIAVVAICACDCVIGNKCATCILSQIYNQIKFISFLLFSGMGHTVRPKIKFVLSQEVATLNLLFVPIFLLFPEFWYQPWSKEK